MSSSDILFKMLSGVIGIAFFGLYWYISEYIYPFDMMAFPYIVLTIYFISSVLSFPFIALKKVHFVSDRFLGQIALLVKFISAPFLLIQTIMNEGQEEN